MENYLALWSVSHRNMILFEVYPNWASSVGANGPFLYPKSLIHINGSNSNHIYTEDMAFRIIKVEYIHNHIFFALYLILKDISNQVIGAR